MGLSFNWFKNYQIIIQDRGGFVSEPYCSDIILTGGDNTSHAYSSVCNIKHLFQKVTGLEFPTINTYSIHCENDDIGLIEPIEMVKYCELILASKEVDLLDERDRVEWFKKLSEQGYYISYDYE